MTRKVQGVTPQLELSIEVDHTKDVHLPRAPVFRPGAWPLALIPPVTLIVTLSDRQDLIRALSVLPMFSSRTC